MENWPTKINCLEEFTAESIKLLQHTIQQPVILGTLIQF